MNKGGVLNKYCPCSGKFLATRDSKQFEEFLKVVIDVARFQEFRYLEELVKPLLFIN